MLGQGVLEKHRRAHIFRIFRKPLRFTVGPTFVAFTAIDYLYIPGYWIEGAVLRSLWYLSVWIALILLANSKVGRKNFELIAVSCLTLASWVVCWMVYRSGGYNSLYLPGLLLVTVSGLQLGDFLRRAALVLSLCSYVPACVFIILTAGIENILVASIQVMFLIGMTLLSWLYKSSEDEQRQAWITRQNRINEQIKELKRTDYLKHNFPAPLLREIQNGQLTLPQLKLHTSAVVGFADIASSTAISNEVDLYTDWTLKEKFLESAVQRATENGLIVLSQQGDGCFFLANFGGGDYWPNNIIAFFENLLLDYQNIKANSKVPLNHLDTGIKFGVAMGPTLVGFIGKDQPYFTANGPDVNLASRLCSEAKKDELIVSARVWYVLKNNLVGWETEKETYSNLKGFSTPIPAVRIRPRLAGGGKRAVCATCGAPLMVISTPEGILDVKCANGHAGNEIQTPRPNRKSSWWDGKIEYTDVGSHFATQLATSWLIELQNELTRVRAACSKN